MSEAYQTVADQAARDAALNVQASFIVQAPAGSGKTELLTQRFLALLAGVNAPEEIVAITFTRKAAAEMRHRIIGKLREAAEIVQGSRDAPHEAHAQKTLRLAQQALAQDARHDWHLLEHPARLRVQTIDSFCSSLVGRMPWLARLGAEIRPSDHAEALYTQAARETLAALETEDDSSELGQALHTLLRHFDNRLGRIESLLAEMLARREQWLPHLLSHNPQHLRAALEDNLREIVEEALAHIAHALPVGLLPSVQPLARQAAEFLRALPEGEQPAMAVLADWQGPLHGSVDELPYWYGLADLLLTKTGGWRASLTKNQGFPAGKEGKAAKDAMLEILRGLAGEESLRQGLVSLTELPPLHYHPEAWQVLQALAVVLRHAAATLWLHFLQVGEVDFSEIQTRALQALGTDDEPTDLALQLDYRLQHVLVDEFQDTSIGQYQLLEALTRGWQPGDGRSLFLVGDPMQSIYLFRQAEVGLFLKAWQGQLGQVALTPLSLTVNFRSQQGVVDWVNHSFAEIFPAEEDIAIGAVSARAAVARKAALPGAAVAVHPIDSQRWPGEPEPVQAEAAQVVALIQQAHQEDPEHSIAVLVRSRSALQAIVPALHAAHIPYRAVDIDPLDQRQPIADLVALTRFFLLPADRVHGLAVLRAPWCGVSLADLTAWCGDERAGVLLAAGEPDEAVGVDKPDAAIQHTGELVEADSTRAAASTQAERNGPIPSLWALLQQLQVQGAAAFPGLSAEGEQRLRHMAHVLLPLRRETGRLTVAEQVERAWRQLAGAAYLPDEAALTDVQSYFSLLTQLEQQGEIDPDDLYAQVARLFASPNTDPTVKVSLMTIHKSKGLEFDVVILPGLGRRPRGDDSPLMAWAEVPDAYGQPRLLLAPTKAALATSQDRLYRYLSRVRKQKLDYEVQRLLYVATTRAKKRLHLLGAAALLKEKDGVVSVALKPASGSLLQVLWPVVQNAYQSFAEQRREQRQAQLEREQASDAASESSAEESSPWGCEPELTGVPLRRLPLSALPALVEDAPAPVVPRPSAVAGKADADISVDDTKTGLYSPLYGRVLGKIIHRVLQQIGQEGVRHWSLERLSSLHPVLIHDARRQGLSATQATQAAVDTQAALAQCWHDPQWRWVIGDGEGCYQDIRHEWALSELLEDGRSALHIIDRSFIDADGIRWVIDYKSDKPDDWQPGDDFPADARHAFLQARAQHHRTQLQRYQRILQRYDPRPVKTGLYFLMLGAWVEVGVD